jgi:hypothetical protein
MFVLQELVNDKGVGGGTPGRLLSLERKPWEIIPEKLRRSR